MRTFIVRLLQDGNGSGRPAAAVPPLRGVVDEVATGMRTTFRDDQELVMALRTALGSGPSGEPSSDTPDSMSGEK